MASSGDGARHCVRKQHLAIVPAVGHIGPEASLLGTKAAVAILSICVQP